MTIEQYLYKFGDYAETGFLTLLTIPIAIIFVTLMMPLAILGWLTAKFLGWWGKQ
jgi:hypothetical protein